MTLAIRKYAATRDFVKEELYGASPYSPVGEQRLPWPPTNREEGVEQGCYRFVGMPPSDAIRELVFEAEGEPMSLGGITRLLEKCSFGMPEGLNVRAVNAALMALVKAGADIIKIEDGLYRVYCEPSPS